MELTESLVLEELKNVIDPELFVNVADLGLVYQVEIADAADGECKTIHIEMSLTSPGCPAGPQLIGDTKRFVGRLEGVDDVQVRIVLDPPWTPDRMTDEARDMLGVF